MSLREDFPAAGVQYLGVESDGWEYRVVFAGNKLADSFAMLRQFLLEEGYADVPLPATADELALFRTSVRQAQLQLFQEVGYVHNPIKIFFSNHHKQTATLILCVFNEQYPDHLLRFHGVVQLPLVTQPLPVSTEPL